MRRKRNWFIKRLVLGFAVAVLVVPSAALAAVDEGGAGQPNSTDELVQGGVGSHGAPGAVFKAAEKATGVISIETVRLNPRSTSSDAFVKAGDYGIMPRVIDTARLRGDAIEVARTHPRNVITADIENVRLQPRTVSTPQVVSTGFDWGDAGIGAGLLLGLMLVGGAAFYAMRQVGKPQTA